MKYSIVLKFIAIVLAACALVTAVVSAFGIALLSYLDLYADADYDRWQERELEQRAQQVGYYALQDWLAETYSDCPSLLIDQYSIEAQYLSSLTPDSYGYTVKNVDGAPLCLGGTEGLQGKEYEFTMSARYPMLAEPDHSQEVWYLNGETFYIHYEYSREYPVTVTLTEDVLTSYNGLPVEYIRCLFGLRYTMIALLTAGLLVFAICAVYLCCAAGRNSGRTTLEPRGLNRLSLDLYLVAAALLCSGGVYVTVRILDAWVVNEALNPGALALAVIALLLVAVIAIGFCFAVAAQVKMPKFFWWHNSVIGWCMDRLWQGLRFLCRAISGLFRLLPTVWRYLLLGGLMGIVPLLFFFLAAVGESFWLVFFFLAILADIGLVCYGGYAYGILLRGAQRMSQGNLRAKIPTKYLTGGYLQCAEHLNALADVATQAAKNQLRSDRMKTELITNVSHDIKTPLTSLINYVDLLQKPHTEQEQTQYLEVLGRQSLRLKKLIDDLMELSKAATGNLNLEITPVDAAEAVKQALGEFSDKLAKVQLIPVFHAPEGVVPILADGRLTWRVLSNLLSNIVKYALPGTRVYIDLLEQQEQVLISLKNISREPLNVSADELTERFVRGDASRNTDGSGLGLNIAQTLMELQKGSLSLLVDGDLFKVTLAFPAAGKDIFEE